MVGRRFGVRGSRFSDMLYPFLAPLGHSRRRGCIHLEVLARAHLGTGPGPIFGPGAQTSNVLKKSRRRRSVICGLGGCVCLPWGHQRTIRDETLALGKGREIQGTCIGKNQDIGGIGSKRANVRRCCLGGQTGVRAPPACSSIPSSASSRSFAPSPPLPSPSLIFQPLLPKTNPQGPATHLIFSR